MLPGKRNPYKGRLTPSQVAEGINSAEDNSKRLYADAVLLLEHGRVATAASLAALAIEEAGKTSILRGLVLARDDKEVAEAWRDYRSHAKKNPMWILVDLVSQGARKLDDFARVFDPYSDHPHQLDRLKQLGFYTDCLGQAEWVTPSGAIDRSLAEKLDAVAGLMSKSRSGGRNVTAREIELWVKHIGPVWRRDKAWMEKALENWYGEMQDSGLMPPGQNEMSQFIRDGVKLPGGPTE
jgi:AbiV family abortive infection protein